MIRMTRDEVCQLVGYSILGLVAYLSIAILVCICFGYVVP